VGAEYLKAVFSKCADDFSSQITRRLRRCIFPVVSSTSEPMSYEAFRLTEHPLCVVCTLPHASAEITNTDSDRKVGAVYGFFASDGTISPVSPLVALSMIHPRPLPLEI